jgi:diguanylate cyclase (GGDEF)-like protein
MALDDPKDSDVYLRPGDRTPAFSPPRIDSASDEVKSAVEQLYSEIQRLRAELDHSHARLAELETLANQDPLLPLLNRRAFIRELHMALGMKRRHQIPASLMYVDMDGLKAINDGYGHAAGDAALQHVSNTIATAIRTTDAVGRLGGDEFGVILLHANQEAAAVKAEEIAKALRRAPLNWQSISIPVSISWGLHEIGDDETVVQVIEAADQAMYHSRSERRRNRTAE